MIAVYREAATPKKAMDGASRIYICIHLSSEPLICGAMTMMVMVMVILDLIN